MGQYQAETSYLKSVLLWLQEYWTEPDPPRIYPLKQVEGGSRHSSARRTHAALNRRNVTIDLPAFLPLRKPQSMANRAAKFARGSPRVVVPSKGITRSVRSKCFARNTPFRPELNGRSAN